MTSAEQALPVLLESVYAAATDPTHWRSFARELEACLGGPGGLLVRRFTGAPGHDFAVSTHGAEYATAYASYYWRINPWDHGAELRRPGVVYTSEELYDPSELLRTEFYSDLLRLLDVQHSIWMCACVTPGFSVELTTQRSNRAGAFADPERTLLEGLAPHLRRAIEISDRLALAQGALSLEVIEGLGAAALAVDSGGRVTAISPGAERLLASKGVLRTSNGRIRATDVQADRKLQALIAASTGVGDAGLLGKVLHLPAAGGPAARATVLPLPRDHPWSQPLALIMLSMPSAKPEVGAISEVLGLTNAEARLVAGLCDGLSLAQYAAAAGITVHTARDYLRRASEKLGHSRQVDLVRAVSGDPLVRVLSRPKPS